MTKDVLIEFSSIQYGAGAAGTDSAGSKSVKTDMTADNAESVSSKTDVIADKTEYTVQGVYYEKSNKHYLLYDEVMEGFKEPVKNRVKFGEDALEITRSGPVNVRMLFENNKKNVANYNTSYGEVQLGINTKKVNISNSPDNILINVEYAIESGGELLSECIIMIEVKFIEN